MASEKVVPKFGEHKNVVNKIQRYACIRALAAAGSSIYKVNHQSLVDAERQIDYSASDELEKIKIEAAISGQESKQAIWNKYVHPTTNFKQQDFIASANFFYSTGDFYSCKHFANLWLENIEAVEDTKHYDYSKVYMLTLSPAFMGDKDHKDRMQALLEKYSLQPSKSYLCRCLKEAIHEIDQVIALKEMY